MSASAFASSPRVLALPLVRLALLSIMLGGVGFGALGPFQAIIAVERLGLSETGLASVLAIGAVLGACTSIALGVLGDQTGQHRLLLALSFGVTALGAGAMTIVPSAWLFILVHAVILPLGGTSMTQTFAIAGLATKGANMDERTQALTLVRAGFSAAYALTPPACAVAVTFGADILLAYHVMAVVNCIALLAVWLLWPANVGAHRPDDAPSPLKALRELTAPIVLVHVVLIALLMSANFLPNTLLPLMIVSTLNGQAAQAGLIAGLIAAIEIPAMLAAPFLARLIGRGPMIAVGAAVYAIFLLGLWQASEMRDVWWLLIPAGLGAGVILSLPLAMLQDLLANRPGAGGALIAVTNVTSMLLAAGFFALGAEVVGLGGSAALAAALSVFAALILLILPQRSVQDA